MLKVFRPFSAWISPVPRDLDRTSVKFALGLAAIALGQALHNGYDFLTSALDIFWLSMSLLFLSSWLTKFREPFRVFFKKALLPVLGAGLILQLFQLWSDLPGLSYVSSAQSTFWLFKLGIIVSGFFALVSLLPNKWIPTTWQNLFVILALLTVGALGIWVIKTSPEPFIDVYVFEQTSAEALLKGQNPYNLTPPNIFGHMLFYGKELVKDGKMTIGNPYPPLSIYVSTLGFLAAGDFRYSHLLAILISGVLIAFLHPGREAKLAAYLFVFTPRIFYVLEQGWTEPVVMLFLSLVIFCAVRYPRWLPISLGLFFASKQYLLFFLPLTLLLNPITTAWRKWIPFFGWMGATMVIVTAPLAFWDLPAFIWNVGLAQWYQVFRMDALSYLALYAHAFQQTPSQLTSFIALAIAFLITWRFTPRTATGFALSIAWGLEIFFAFNKQAFCNYYSLVIGAICWTFAALTAEERLQSAESASTK